MKQKKKKKKELEKKINDRLIKDRIIRDIRTLFKKEDDYHKPKRVINFRDNNYIKCESNGDENRNLSLDEYLNKIKPYWMKTVIFRQNFYTWKIQLTIAINLISSKHAEEEHVTQTRSDNIKFTSFDDANEIVNELFKFTLFKISKKS